MHGTADGATKSTGLQCWLEPEEAEMGKCARLSLERQAVRDRAGQNSGLPATVGKMRVFVKALVETMRSALRSRSELALENLALRQQLAVFRE